MKNLTSTLATIVTTTSLTGCFYSPAKQEYDVNPPKEQYRINISEKDAPIIIKADEGEYIFDIEIEPVYDRVLNPEGNDIEPNDRFPFAARFFPTESIRQDPKTNEKIYEGNGELFTFTKQDFKSMRVYFSDIQEIPEATFKRNRLTNRRVRYFEAKDDQKGDGKTLDTIVLIEGKIPENSKVDDITGDYFTLYNDSKNYTVFIGTGNNIVKKSEANETPKKETTDPGAYISR